MFVYFVAHIKISVLFLIYFIGFLMQLNFDIFLIALHYKAASKFFINSNIRAVY